MFAVVLVHPEIPPNTGNVIRLTVNTATELHLVEPLGFRMDDRDLRRAGLDYHEYARVNVHDDLGAFIAKVAPRRVFAVSTRGRMRYDCVTYANDDALLFGPETRGLPQEIIDGLPEEQRLRLPMRAGNRSLNLSNAVAVIVFEAWRQRGFAGSDVGSV